MYEDYFLTLRNRGYSVYNYSECRNCVIFILEKFNDASKKKYMLKLFMSRNSPDSDTLRSWYNSYRIRSEKLGRYHYDDVKIPHILEFWGNEYVNGFGKTFGVLADYIKGRTLSSTLCNGLDTQGERQRLLLRVMPDYIGAVEYGNKAGYYHLDIDECNLLVDIHNRGWLIDHIGAFICDDYSRGKQPFGGYFHCYSEKIAAAPSEAHEKGARCKADSAECERLQTIMLIRLINGVFDRDTTEDLIRRCVDNAGGVSPLRLLRESLGGLDAGE